VAADQQRTLPEMRAELQRLLLDLETGRSIVIGNQLPLTSEDRARQIGRLKEVIGQVDEAQNAQSF
jgi:hypothetical protein